MTPSTKTLLLGVAMLLPLAQVASAQDNAKSAVRERPKTVRQLFTELGTPAKDVKQLKLKISGKTEGEDIGSLPKEMQVELLYDKVSNRMRVEIESAYEGGRKSRITTYAELDRAARWIGTPGEEGLKVQPLEPTLTLPNPWSLPPMLTFPGLFADWSHGYAALGKEFSRSKPLGSVPDEGGLRHFRLNPSPSAGPAMRNQIEDGMVVKAGFDAKTGMLQVLTVQHKEPKATLTLRVLEQSTELTEKEIASFGIPDEVMELIRNPPKTKPIENPFRASPLPVRKAPEKSKGNK